MNILLTNDDGIDSPGLRLLAKALRAQGLHRVFILAPDSDRSGVSGAISFLRGPLRLAERESDSWACSGNPADCVVLALLGAIPLRPDLVISGINRGANMGTDLIYSGTAAAARQGSLFGIPSIALSLANTAAVNTASVAADTPGAAINTSGAVSGYYWDMAVSFVLAHLDEFASQWEADTYINVNIPNGPAGPDGIAAAFPSKREYRDALTSFKAPNGDTWCFVKLGEVTTKPEPGSDWDVVSRNLASVSPILIHPVNGGKGIDAGGGGRG
ncbi:5'-nucleotidase SurE [Spirochaetia bacterium]|nr:5'-nucleotidase SurE [Spirochaetia bacterium]